MESPPCELYTLKLPATLTVAVDAPPLSSSGSVSDSINIVSEATPKFMLPIGAGAKELNSANLVELSASDQFNTNEGVPPPLMKSP